MLICKILLAKFIHEVTSIIIFDCRDNYSDIQQNSRAKRKVLKNEKCTWSSQECICSIFYFTNRLLNVLLKRKTINILHHHTAYDYRKGSKSCRYTTSKCWYTTSKPFFPRKFTNTDLLLTNVAVCDKPN